MSLFSKLKSLSLMDLAALVSRPMVRHSAGDAYHTNFAYFLDEVAKRPGCKVLELGSRNSQERQRFPHAQVTGLDIHAGPGVDVVGDIHRLTRHFPNQTFDAVFSISTFEHLAMPWKAALEISQVLAPGGLLFIATHPTWPPHELPWDFYRFSPEAFRMLLGPSLGFEIVRLGQGLECRIVPLNNERSTRRIYNIPAYMGVSVVARKVSEPKRSLSWDIDVLDELKDVYPAP